MVCTLSVSLVLLALTACVLGGPMPYVVIQPGIRMPVVGLGTCCGAYNISEWIAQGFRHIDTSCDYGSEPTIGAAIRASGVPREQFFITSKINPENYGPDVTTVVQVQVLQPLEVDYVDLLLMHHAGRPEQGTWNRPPCFVSGDPRGTYYTCRIETYKSMQQIQSRGLVKAIGVSNWEQRDLDQLFNVTRQYPAVNQIEFHPSWYTEDLNRYCNTNNISITAYGPMGAYPRSDDVVSTQIAAVAQAHNKSPGQVMLRWALQKGAGTVIPRSQTPAHMTENGNIFDFTLTNEEVASLDNFPQRKVYATQCQPWC